MSGLKANFMDEWGCFLRLTWKYLNTRKRKNQVRQVNYACVCGDWALYAPLTINLVPRALSAFEMAGGKTSGQGCQNTPKYWSILSRNTCEMSEWIQITRNKHDCISLGKKTPKTPFQSVSRDKILHNSWRSILAALFSGFYAHRHFESREGPGTRLTELFTVLFVRRDEEIHRGVRYGFV